MLALALLGQSATALADGRDVLADAKDNRRIDGCYSAPGAQRGPRPAAAPNELLYGVNADLIRDARITNARRPDGRCGGSEAAGAGRPRTSRAGRSPSSSGRRRWWRASPRSGTGVWDEPRPARRRRVRRLVKDVLLPVAVAVALAFVIQASVAKPYEIPTPSMAPTIEPGDRIIANRLVYRFRDIERGDIIVFDPPPSATRECGDGAAAATSRS